MPSAPVLVPFDVLVIVRRIGAVVPLDDAAATVAAAKTLI